MASPITVPGTYFGNTGCKIESGGELTEDNRGMYTGSVVFSVKAGNWADMPGVGSKHPYCDFCVMEKRKITFAAGFWKITGDYVGARGAESSSSSSDDGGTSSSDSGTGSSSSDDGSSSDDEANYAGPPVYELTPGTGTERIETHPKFVSDIGGTAAHPLNGAIFRDENGFITTDNKTGIFERFRVMLEDGRKNPWAGLEQFLSINGTTWTKSWVSRAAPSTAGVGITNHPPGIPPSFGGNYNWLALPPSYTKRGNVYECKQVFLLSGPQGWNQVLYANQ